MRRRLTWRIPRFPAGIRSLFLTGLTSLLTAEFVRQIHRREMIAILSNDQDPDVLGMRTQVLRLLKRDAAAKQ